MAEIIKASVRDLAEIVPLFDQYRIFYGQPTSEEAAREYLLERLERDECIIFLAKKNGITVGFTLLYTTFSSVSMKPIYILNDLYVIPEYRKQGIGELLLEKSKELCIRSGYKGVALETAADNPAQALYEKLGWVKDTHCFHYFWMVG